MAEELQLTVEEQEALLDTTLMYDLIPAREAVNKMAGFVGLDLSTATRDSRKNVIDEETTLIAIVFSDAEGNKKVTYSSKNNDVDVTGGLFVEEGGVKVLKGYEFEGEEIVEDVNDEVTDEFLEEVEDFDIDFSEFEGAQLDDNTEADSTEENGEVVEQGSWYCLYGNWCGPKCSGPLRPVNKVDRCCEIHDHCYGKHGYFNCRCDREVAACLRPYARAGNKSAAMMATYFRSTLCRTYRSYM